MNRELGLRILGQIMGWDNDTALDEFRWLSFMSAYKYDEYRDFLAGARFIESLATWLQQFNPDHRGVAYSFIKEKLIYFSLAEIHRLVEKFYPELVQQDLVCKVAQTVPCPPYMVWSSQEKIDEYRKECRKTLFMGLSDGARIDTLRRVNVGQISNEQFVIATQIDHHKWRSLIKDLREDLDQISPGLGNGQKFSRVYLIDDFTASGTSLLPDPNVTGELKGKLVKFARSLTKAKSDLDDESPFEDNFDVVVHHYIGTEKAKNKIEEIYSQTSKDFHEFGLCNVRFTYGMVLSSDLQITPDSGDPIVELCQKYYDPALEGDGKHGGQSGTTDKMFGYAGCGLPVVLEHNTPNNSLPLLWALTKGGEESHAMRPLFRRRERHSDMEGG